MARESLETMCDLGIPDVKRNLMSIIGRMAGWWEIRLTPRRGTRSQQQQKYYFAVVVESLYRYLKDDCGWELAHKGDAHEWAKSQFLRVAIIKRETGEIVGERIGSTGELDTAGMSEFTEAVRRWLDDKGVMTPDPDPEWASHREAVAS